MKRITLLIVFLICLGGFAQQVDLKSVGERNAVHYQKQQKASGVTQKVLSPQANAVSKKERENASHLGASDFGHKKVNKPILKANSVRDLGSRSFNGSSTVNRPLNSLEQQEILANEAAMANRPFGILETQVVHYANRPLSNITPTAGATESFTPVVGDHFFDPGGPGGTNSDGGAGNYPNCGCATQTTLLGVSQLKFNAFQVFATFDYLRIYDGIDATGTLLYDNGSGGPNSGDILLSDMIASHGSDTFNSTSGDFFFYFHASAVVNREGWDVEIMAAGGGGGATFPEPYCGALLFPSVEAITLVEVAGISNVTSASSTSPAHEDFTAISGDMVQGETYTITFEGNTSGSFTNRFVVFIDWNQNGILDDAGEVFAITETLVNSTGVDGKQVSGQIIVPAGALEGSTRMRVKKIFGTTNYLNPCLGGSWGQAEDYTIDVTASTGGGGGATACNQDNIGDGIEENAFTTSKNQSQIIATDITVPVDVDFSMEKITVNIWRSPGESVVDADIIFYNDASGAPGSQRDTQNGVVPVSQTIIGSAFGFDISEVVFNLSPVMLDGQENSITTYWVSLHVGITAGPGYIGSTQENIAGYESFFSADAGVTWSVNASWDTIYDFEGQCTSISGGGGGTVACSQEHATSSDTGGTGSSVNSDFKSASDILVAAGVDFTLESIEVPFLTFAPNSPPVTANIVYYESAGGLPGTQIGSETVVPTILSSGPWVNPVADKYVTSLTVTPFTFDADANVDTTYWIEISMGTANSQGTVFWEYTLDTPVEGYPYARFDATVQAWSIVDPGGEVIYKYTGVCGSGGGGGGSYSCNTIGPSNNFENGKSFTQNLGRIVANDITVIADEDFNFETINITSFIGSPGDGVNAANVDVYIYANAGGQPGALITSQLGLIPTSQTSIGAAFGYEAFSIDIDISDIELLGQAGAPTTYWVGLSLEATNGSNTFWENSSAGLIGFGQAYNDGTGFIMEALEGVYTFAGTCIPHGGSTSNDDCSGAIALSCGDSVTGETITATDSGGNAAPDVFYKYTGSGTTQLVTISLCGGGTDFDSVLRVFDNCNLSNEIAFNDDFCGLQSELSFVSNGTSTYYIMVEGSGSASGNFSLDITCENPLANDECSGAIAVSCGDSITGTTIGATIDTNAPACGPNITSPGVWYTLDDNSGLPGEITLSLCNGTDFDSKITVYSGNCSSLVCIGGNDDACGLQSEYTFPSNGNTTYYILIHSFAGETGNFTLDVTCSPTPPPNDRIENSINVSALGFPYTDPQVAMPAATIENGSPTGCDITGANGVWYHFTSAYDGTAEASIVTPGGTSSVTFYTAPNTGAIETDLTLVAQNTNQCLPGTSASIITEAGQVYYVFVVNTVSSTDIKIDGTNLGISNNDITGFTYYPNPTSGILYLKSIDKIDSVEIFNMLGQKVLENKLKVNTAQLDISDLSFGTYIMKAMVNGKTATFKVVKN